MRRRRALSLTAMSGLAVLGVCVCILASALASSFGRGPAPLRDRAAQPPDGQQAHAHGEKAQDIVHCLSSDPSLTGTVRWKFICAGVTSARYATLRVPDVEASNVKLNAFASRRADPFHDKLRRGDDLLTGVTRLAVAGATPEARDTVLGQATVSELASNQTAENLLFHVAPITCWRRQIHRGNTIVRRSPAQRLLDFGPTLYPPMGALSQAQALPGMAIALLGQGSEPDQRRPILREQRPPIVGRGSAGSERPTAR